MKKVLLILLMLLLPWQAFAAAERNLTHVLGGDGLHGQAVVMKHIAEHASHVMHHHDDVDDDTHEDDSEQSAQHMLDFEQDCGMLVLLSADISTFAFFRARVMPAIKPDAYSGRTTLPLLRPPRLSA